VIISFSVSANDDFILINTGENIINLRLWRMEDGSLLKTYYGHTRTSFIINCGFLNEQIIYSTSEDGFLYYWHLN